MKHSPANGLIAQLNRIKIELDAFAHPESRTAFLQDLDELIVRLSTLREQLANAPLEAKLSEIGKPLAEVIKFLELAKYDQSIATLISQVFRSRTARQQRTPVNIPANANDQIRALLAQDLSKRELKAIATQRGISVGKRSAEDVRRDILRALERQEGYERLASPRV